MNILKTIVIILGLACLIFGVIIISKNSGPMYDTTISGRGVASDASATDFAKPDPMHDNLVTDGFAKRTVLSNGSIRYVDSVYYVDRTWKAAYSVGKTDGSVIRFWGGILLLFITMTVFIILTIPGKLGDWVVIIPILGILIGGPLTGSGFQWNKWNSTRQILKGDYTMDTTTGSKTIDERFWNLPAKSF